MRNFGKSRLRKCISIVASLVLLLSSIMPTVPVFANGEAPACASDPSNYAYIGNTCYTSLKNAIDGASSGNTIVLTQDLRFTANIGGYIYAYVEKNINIDLNGHTIDPDDNVLWFKGDIEANIYSGKFIDDDKNGELFISDGAKLTIKDGEYKGVGYFPVIHVQQGSELVIESATITTTETTAGAGIRNEGTLTIENATITATNYLGIQNEGTLTIENATITAPNYLGINNEGTLTIENATITGKSGIKNHAGKNITIDDVIIITTNGKGIRNEGNITMKNGTINTTNEYNISTLNGSTLSIQDGTFSHVDNYGILYVEGSTEITIGSGDFLSDGWVILGNGSEGKGGYTININGGTFTTLGNFPAVYHPNNGTLNIADGRFEGADALYLKSGETNISGGKFIGKGNQVDFEHRNDGIKPTGDGVVVEVCNYSGGQATLNVTAGEFESDNAEAIASYAQEGYTVLTNFIEGGIFSTVPDESYIVEGKKAFTYGNKYKVATVRTVTFDPNNKSATTSIDIEDGTTVTKPANPTNTGYIFQGWFNGDSEFNFEDVITANITLTGRWESIAPSSTGGDADNFYASGFVFDAVEGLSGADSKSSVEAAVASSNFTAELQGSAELNVYPDADADGELDNSEKANKINLKVNFTAPVLVKIPVGTTGAVKVKVRHNEESTFTTIGLTTNSGASCTSGVASDPYTETPVTPKGGYVEIWTCSASTFVAYTETGSSSGSSTSGSGSSTSGSGSFTSSSGGGGSSSSYSCKNLPAHAVANNTSKPKKNTDYSYSTDKDAVCTFQCKSGYTRNEETSKCENIDGTTVDSNTSDTDADDTTINEDLQKVLEDGYTVELHRAYEFAFKHGITTMPSIEEAQMDSPLTRIAMAKMLSQYAINVLGKKPANVVVPNFSDVSAELDEQYNNGVTLAYQLGIMGINIDNFRPDDLVTRAEFGTALSRLLYETPDGEELYYETHLKKLVEEKIITNDDPGLEELRGYVMIMLMRSK